MNIQELCEKFGADVASVEYSKRSDLESMRYSVCAHFGDICHVGFGETVGDACRKIMKKRREDKA